MTSMQAGIGRFIVPVPGLDVANLSSSNGAGHDGPAASGDVVLRTPSTTLRLKGGLARVVRDRILPALARPRPRADLLDELSDLPAVEIDRLVGSLLDAGVLVEVDNDPDPLPSWLYSVSSSARERKALAGRLAALRVVLIGRADVTEAVRAALTGSGIEPDRVVRAPYPRQRDELPALMAAADLVLAADDGSLPVLHAWVNTVGLQLDIPTLHADLRGSRATIGPLVLPAESPCYLCWRMRALACEEDFAAAMALEEELDAHRLPEAAARPVLPALLPMVTGALVAELFALTLAIAPPRLAAGALTLDALGGTAELHPVLPRPDCPACAKKDRRPLEAVLPDQAEAGLATTDFDGIARRAVDPLCGLVRALEVMPKDVDEPERPFVVRAELANAHFRASTDAFVTCSGKGWTRRQARDSALGEALERYAAMTWRPERKISSTYDGLDRPGLHPRDLVLFADHQYDTVPFQPWRPETELEWVPAQSLVTGDEVWIPLLATHLGYRPSAAAALFPATSNGFAAGPDRAGATLRALLEVIERDAFAIAWSHRLPGRCVAAADVPDEQTRAIAATHARRGVEFVVHLLPTDTSAAVVLAVAWSHRAPAAVIGLAAALEPVAAARSAVLEVTQVRPLLRSRLRQPGVRARMAELAAAPSKVATLDDHDLVYADPAAAAAGMRFLRDAPQESWPDPAPSLIAQGNNSLASLTRSLAEVAPDVLAVDVTPPDVVSLGVRVVRGVVPGFVPIWFGADQARLGGSRLLEMPSRIGLRPGPVRLDELNLDPHPLA
jgi:bacteriocin biosynthesis cyclodehydratase domain-containing protein